MKTIKIPANLTKEKEAIEVAKQILKNPILIGNNNNILLIGNETLEVQELNSFIKIERIPKEPLMIVCSCCETNFEKSIGKKLFVNYGGTVKTKLYCSDKCRINVMSVVPENRRSITKSKIKQSYFY